ncbi:GNAT family N-acetyltransferase [Klebsiella sp. DNRA6]|uniref:GNAT family N-acetyltransferase n=1 Tax=Klebsiella sp. DNRA6 TaxID=2723057 RepID=UPI001474EF1F|nr:GNAT family N-acetyltransferase [Klebsiella sp. DNRA6]NMD82240.1 GNAT family N-acetyltransferase [Klebsiella sp. DNRA6]
MYIETERLILRRWNRTDAFMLSEINSEPDVMLSLGRGVMSVEDACNNIVTFEQHFERHGFGLWAVERKYDLSLIGLCGLRIVSNNEYSFAPCTEISWVQKRELWGNGYMTEAAIASIEDGFQRVKIKKIYSWTAQVNYRSQNLMRRAGMHREEKLDFDHPRLPVGHPLSRHLVYLINAPKV